MAQGDETSVTRDELLSDNGGELRSAALEELMPHRLGWPGDRGYRDWEPLIDKTLPPFDNWCYGQLAEGPQRRRDTLLNGRLSQSKARKTADTAGTASRRTVTSTPHRVHVSTPS